MPLIVFPIAALAQDQPDMQKLMEIGTPGPNHKLLQQFVGKWDVEVWYKMGTMEGRSKAACEIKPVHEGRYFLADYKSEMMGQPFFVQQTFGYDNLRKKFFEFQIESDNTGYVFYTGSASADGKRYEFSTDSFDPMTMKPAKLRIVKQWLDKDKFVIEWYMTKAGEKEQKVVTLTHTRSNG